CYFLVLQFVYFFFSSRRRHTRSDRDWSSDVCSSDLSCAKPATQAAMEMMSCFRISRIASRSMALVLPLWIACKVLSSVLSSPSRSEERRVGKECRTGWEPYL